MIAIITKSPDNTASFFFMAVQLSLHIAILDQFGSILPYIFIVSEDGLGNILREDDSTRFPDIFWSKYFRNNALIWKAKKQ